MFALIFCISSVEAENMTLKLGFTKSFAMSIGKHCFENRSTLDDCRLDESSFKMQYTHLLELHPSVKVESKFYDVEYNSTMSQHLNSIFGAVAAGRRGVCVRV